MKKIILVSMLLLFVASVSASPLYTSIRYEEYPEYDINMIYFNVYNAGDDDYDDLQAIVRIPELDEFFISDEFDLDEDEHFSGTFYYVIPANTRPGDYDILYTVSGDDIQVRKYRYFTI